jgi:mannose-6-phosphate isomerase
MDLCPLLFEARLVPKLWGGRRLRDWGQRLPEGQAVGEAWLLFDDPQGSVTVAAGPAAGKRLGELVALWGERLLGPALSARGGSFPLLIKLIDASDDLSVQVHPDDALARELHGPAARGKSEMWVLLQADEGARLLSGFKPGVTAEAFERALADGSVTELLQSVAVKAGDVVDIPAGRVHAIGAGCLVAEVQQNCDLTYRVWDFGRLENGQPRALHLAEARRALRFDGLGRHNGLVEPPLAAPFWGRREGLVAGPYFSVERWTLSAEAPLPAGPWPRLVLALQGELRLVWGEEAGMIVPKGGCAMLPASLDARLGPQGGPAQCLMIEPR